MNGILGFFRKPHPFGYSSIILAVVLWAILITAAPDLGEQSMISPIHKPGPVIATLELLTFFVFTSAVFASILLVLVAVAGVEWTTDKKVANSEVPYLSYGNLGKWVLKGAILFCFYPLWLLWKLCAHVWSKICYNIVNTRWFPDSFQ